MKFEEDYVMRMIKDMVKALASVVFGKRFTEYEVEEEKADDTDFLYRDIIEMADRGKNIKIHMVLFCGRCEAPELPP